jgi:hypothetical protein
VASDQQGSQQGAQDQGATADDVKAERAEERNWRDSLPPEQRAQLLLRQAMSRLAGAIAGTSWGKGISEQARRGVAAYCHQYGVDPITEIDWLGGSLYVNSAWYERKLGELRASGRVTDFWLDQIAADPRLQDIVQDDKAPVDVREAAGRERIRKGVPDAATSAHVCYIKLPAGGHPIEGVKWGGGGTSVMQPRNGGGMAPNPIVEANAVLSTESQAIRRAVMQMASHVTGVLGVDPARMDDDLETLNVRVTANVAQDGMEPTDQGTRPQRLAAAPPVMALPAGDVYGLDQQMFAARTSRDPIERHMVPARERQHAPASDDARQMDLDDALGIRHGGSEGVEP